MEAILGGMLGAAILALVVWIVCGVVLSYNNPNK